MNALPATTVVNSFAEVDFSDMRLPMLVVYERPKDFPNHYVVRVWEASANQPTNIAAIAKSLDLARAMIPGGFVRLDRDPSDDPVIVESYV